MRRRAVSRLSALAVVVGLTTSAACARNDTTPPGYQGLVALDERVLAFEVPGRVNAVSVRRGDKVTQGVVVAKLDDTLQRLTVQARTAEEQAARADFDLLVAGPRRQDVAAAAAEVAAAAASEDLARKTVERVRMLRAGGALSQAESDDADAAYARATEQKQAIAQRLSSIRAGARPEELARAAARRDAAHAALELENERLARFALKAQVEGTVVDVHVLEGELAAIGTPAVTVADAAHPFVEVFVPEAELTGLHVGTVAHARTDATKQPLPGVIEHIASSTEFTPRFLFSPRERPNLVVRVRVRLDDPARTLHAGIPAFVELVR